MKNTELENRNSRKKLKRIILINMIIVPFLPFVLAIGVSFYNFTTELEKKTTNSLKRIIVDHREMIESFLEERKADLEFIVDTYDFNQIKSPGVMNEILRNLKNRSNAFVDLGVFDARGVHVVYSGQYKLKGKTYAGELWFKKVMTTGCYISDVFLGYRNEPHFVVAVRQESIEGAWVLRATIDTLLFDRLVSKVRMGQTGEAYILNKKGSVQTLKRSDGIRILENDPDFIKFSIPETGIQTFIQSDKLKNEYLYAATWLKEREWLLIVRQGKKDAYRSLYSALNLSLFIMVAGGGVIAALAFYMAERVLKNIDRLGMEKESLGHQLIRATQLAEIGEMSTGFAHEINNPLQIIKSEQTLIEMYLDEISADISIHRLKEMEEIRDSLDQIKLQVGRCSDITRAILKFGRKSETKPQLLSPGKIIPEIMELVNKKAQVNGIEIVSEISKEAPDFMGDPSQFQQVLLNLFNNAIDAVFEKHGSQGGVMTIAAFKGGGNRLEIRISDNGVGIKKEDIDKVFSPFFTTKPVGKGTGLGLSVCYGIIEGFGGTMVVESKEGNGTTFLIELPVCDQNLKEVNNEKDENYAG